MEYTVFRNSTDFRVRNFRARQTEGGKNLNPIVFHLCQIGSMGSRFRDEVVLGVFTEEFSWDHLLWENEGIRSYTVRRP